MTGVQTCALPISDWSPTQQQGAVNCRSDYGCSTAPQGYAGYRLAGSVYSSSGNDTINISSANRRGISGKGFTFWNEVCDSCGWASDGLLDIKLNQSGYSELYVRFFIKFQPGWQWSTSVSPIQKFFRISHYKGGNPFVYGPSGSHGPLVITDLAKYNKGASDIAMSVAYRYENVYYPTSASPYHSYPGTFYFGSGSYGGGGTDFSDSGMMGDGQWHSWEFHVKINSSIGVPDGEYTFWQDGNLVVSVTDLAWGDNGGQSNPRKLWNYIQIGGNNNNPYSPQSQSPEQWYAIDDVVISTNYIGPNYVIGGGTPLDTLAPAPPPSLW